MKFAYPTYKLEDLTESVIYGHTASATKEDSGSKFLRITDIQNGTVNWNSVPFCECSKKEIEKYLLKRGDIVFARTGATTGKSYLINYCPEASIFASYLIRVRPNEKIDSDFLARFFETPDYWNQIQKNSRGATLPGVNATKLKELRIPLPPLAEQKRIAAILDKADAIRHKRQQAIKLADEFLRATFLDMFGDPVTNPKGWARSSLAKLIKVKSGNFLPAKNIIDGKHPVYGGNGVNGFHNEYMFNAPMIVIGRVGIYCGAIHKTKPKSWITDNALYVAEKSNRVKELYLEWALRFANLNQYASKSGQPLLSGGRIYTVEINVPLIEKQQAFERIEIQVADMRKKLSKSSGKSGTLFNSITQRAFRGEL